MGPYRAKHIFQITKNGSEELEKGATRAITERKYIPPRILRTPSIHF